MLVSLNLEDAKEIERLTAELQRMSVELEAQKGLTKRLMIDVDVRVPVTACSRYFGFLLCLLILLSVC